jgi:hypothetical protein
VFVLKASLPDILPASADARAVIGGLQETIRLCKDCHDAFVLRALGKVVVAMVPFPDDLLVSIVVCRYVLSQQR